MEGVTAVPRLTSRPSNWIKACVVAEAIGMTAAAAAARTGQDWVTGDSGVGPKLAALAVIVAGGLVEGTGLGILQARSLRTRIPTLPVVGWTLVTVLVAGLGWAAASAPGALTADSGDGPSVPWWLTIAGPLALGAVMGALLGAAQATRLRGRVRHPWRWVAVNAWGWAPAMAIVFIGASVPGADWPDLLVVLAGTLTGALAGAALGLVTGALMPAVDGTPVRDRFVLALTRLGLLRRQVAVLTLHGATTGRLIELPVQYAVDDGALVVVPGHPETKRWWRNLRTPAVVDVRVGHRESTALGSVLEPGEPEYDHARRAYVDRWKGDLPGDIPIVRLVPRDYPPLDLPAGVGAVHVPRHYR